MRSNYGSTLAFLHAISSVFVSFFFTYRVESCRECTWYTKNIRDYLDRESVFNVLKKKTVDLIKLLFGYSYK